MSPAVWARGDAGDGGCGRDGNPRARGRDVRLRAVVAALALLAALGAGNAAAQTNTACPPEVPVLTNWAFVPSGLDAGDTFRLIFVTSTVRAASLSAIRNYNNYVQNAITHSAVSPHADKFRVVGSTATVDARDNTCTTGTGVRIYWLNGNKVADDYADFYDGSWDDETNPRDESGNSVTPVAIWTGSGADGTADGAQVLGRDDGQVLVAFGRLNNNNGGPLNAGEQDFRGRARFYGLSPVFRVQDSRETLVANFDQSSGSGAFNVLSNVSQSFTTGAHAGGYRIKTVATKLTRSSSFSMSLCSTDSRSRPTSTCTVLTAPSTTTAGSPVVFTAPANTVLEANTTYAAVLSGFHNRLTLDYTQSGGEDSTSATGWSIGNAYHLWHPGSNSWYRRAGVILRLSVVGTPATRVAVPGAPRNLAATVTDTTEIGLTWDAPSNNGGGEITDYEIRHAQGSSVPGTTTWTSAGSDRTETVTGLTSGQQYAFEVRAVNSAGSGTAASVQATVPTSLSDGFTARFANVPASHRGSAGQLHYEGVGVNDFTFELHFSVDPTTLTSYTEVPGLLEVSGAELHKARRLNPPSNVAWEVRVRPTQNGDITITLPVRACAADNSVCADGQPLAAAVSTTVKGRALSASFADVPAGHDGSTFTLHFQLSHEPDPMSFTTVRDSLFDVTGGAIEYVRRVRPGQNREWELRVRPFSGDDDVTLTLKATTACETPPGICAGGQMLPGGLTVTVFSPATLSVADASARETEWLHFPVTLSRARTTVTTVDYATSAGTATSNLDYQHVSGTLTFAPGETSKTIRVQLVADAEDDGGETLTLTLSNPTPSEVLIADGEATGTIKNTGPMPRAWLARLGRTVGTHVTDAVSARFRGGAADSHVTVGGYRLPLGRRGPAAGTTTSRPVAGDGAAASSPPSTRLRALATASDEPAGAADEPAGGTATSVLTEVARVLGMDPGGPGPAPEGADSDAGVRWDPRLGQSRTLDVGQTLGQTFDLRRLLLGSSFRLNLNAAPADGDLPRLTAWGRVAGTTFDGRENTLTLDGDVLTGTVGVDGTWDRIVAGIAVAHSRGDGGYRTAGQGQGELESTLTSLHPYLRYQVTDRLDVWGVLGYGWGDLELKSANQTLETDTTLLMGAFGSRGILLAPAATGGVQLATRTDAMFTRTSSDAVTGNAGTLAASEADAHRLRMILEGQRAVTWADGRRLTPTVELGVRHDWGDAETGFGLEVGGRVQYADPRLGLTVDGAVRALLAHEDTDYQEWGASGNLRLAPRAGGQGLALTLAPAWGATGGGVDGLWSRQTTQGLAPQTRGRPPGGRLAADVGYGLAAFGTGLLTPYAGTVLAEGAARTYRVGTRWTSVTGLTLNLEGTRQDPTGQQPVNQGLRFQATWGF